MVRPMESHLPRPITATGNRLLHRFLLVAVLMYLAWFFGYEQWLAYDGRLDHALCAQISAASGAVLQTLGFAAAIAPANNQLVIMNDQPAVIVGVPCDGLVLYPLFGGFIHPGFSGALAAQAVVRSGRHFPHLGIERAAGGGPGHQPPLRPPIG